MPPKRCPECGRFLSNDFVASLAVVSASCPRCETLLAPDMVVGGSSAGRPTQPREHRAHSSDGSVRPPDLDPSDVRRQDPDVLAGWDLGATPEEVASWRSDRPPFPVDTIIVATGAVAGAVVAGLLARQHRPGWVAVGTLGGATVTGAWRRVWELRP